MALNILLVAIGLFLLLIIFYSFIPEILLHLLGVGSWKRQYLPGVTLTFDDGPDPDYTPRLLEILRAENIKACFFLVGEKAEKYPEIVQMIKEQGHQIGSHGYLHRHSWLMSPRKTMRLWNKSIRTLQNITGEQPTYIRAPWGGFNLALYFWCIIHHKKAVSWTVHGRDWRQERTPAQISARILKRVKEGAIILLHDSGGDPGAPENTLACLPNLCSVIRHTYKLPILPLSFPGWPLYRRLFYRIWEKWERFYAKIFKIKRIDDHNLFRLALTRYQGPDLRAPNGETLATKGDLVGEIHFDNIRLQLIGGDLKKSGVRALKMARSSLPVLAKYIAENPEFKNIRVYLGVTLINRGVKALGFNVEDYPSRNGRFIAFMQKIIMRIYHPAGNRDTKSLGDKPKIVWISKETLLEKYYTDDKIIS